MFYHCDFLVIQGLLEIFFYVGDAIACLQLLDMVFLANDKLLILRNVFCKALNKLSDPLFFLFDVAWSYLEIFRIDLEIFFRADEFRCPLFEPWDNHYGAIIVRFKCDIEPLLGENLLIVGLHQDSRGVEVFLFALRVRWLLAVK